ncbi:MAG: peptidylprolyl isomerase [Candidatus Methylarchaceae archaeon HK01B]|nr:peptidylprolyl isomerase [Candidatus Methylarchaceae archaeon HK01M]MCP8312243.1 peptidylprolyl isomerase [Candidatus Methylarchaceae archaeon HK02M1]MCP8318722.1 peptidylprolyl isomerase [Candidatus Methylarchaceae archaeon HK01B]
MPLDAGTLVYINYTAKIKDVEKVIEVTVEDEAKKLGVHDPAQRYEPRLVAIGEGWVLKGLDEALMTADVGEKISVEVAPEKGFGQRDPSKVNMIALRKFGKKASELRIGDEIEIDNKIGIVRFVGSGRAQIDFNHRLAGKTLLYEVEVVKKLETDREKIVALIKRRIFIEEEKIDFTIEDDNIKIQLPRDLYLVEGIQIIKRAISNDLFKFIKVISKVYFIELYESKKPFEQTEPEEEKTTQEE